MILAGAGRGESVAGEEQKCNTLPGGRARRGGGERRTDRPVAPCGRRIARPMTSRLSQTLLIAFVIALVISGCAWSPEAKKARHLQRGDRYFTQQQYREAILEYHNVLQVDASNARAIQQLGISHYRLGNFAQAFPYLLKTKELDSTNFDARLKLGTIYLAGRRLKEAQDEANFVLGQVPKHFEALMLFAGAASSPTELDTAIRRLKEARAEFGDRAKFHIALATLFMRKQDLAGAERSLQQAVATEPQSIEAHAALGDLYMGSRNIPQAEREYRAAAALAPVGSPAWLKLADFYLLRGNLKEAKRILVEVTEKVPDHPQGWLRRAEIAFAHQQFDESLGALEVILRKNPSDLEALLLRGRVHLAKYATPEATEEFQKILRIEPRFARARHQLAVAYLQAGNPQQAKRELTEAATIAPDMVEAALLLAEVNIGTGSPRLAIETLEKLIAKHPRMVQAYVLLGSAYLARREPAKATEAYRKIGALAPKDPRGPHLVGLGLRAQGKRGEARKAFEASLALAPDYVEPLTQLASMAFAEKQPHAALQQVKSQIALVPQSGPLHSLLGGVHLARGEVELAEAAYLRALELAPRLIGAYVQLATIYGTSGKYDHALAKLNGALAVNPKNLFALMLSGIVHERKGDIPRAQQAYERVLALEPRFAPAANNLAWLYSEHGGDKEKALRLAQTAKEVAPEEPHISDTLGWILYKRDLYHRALSLLKESAAKLPENPEVQYHLGMAFYKTGDKEGARKALTLAASSPATFVGKDEARVALAELK